MWHLKIVCEHYSMLASGSNVYGRNSLLVSGLAKEQLTGMKATTIHVVQVKARFKCSQSSEVSPPINRFARVAFRTCFALLMSGDENKTHTTCLVWWSAISYSIFSPVMPQVVPILALNGLRLARSQERGRGHCKSRTTTSDFETSKIKIYTQA